MSLPLPRTALGRVWMRRLLLAGMVAMSVLCAGVELWSIRSVLGVPYAGVVAAIASLGIVAYSCLFVFALAADYRSRPVVRRATAAIVAAGFAAVGYVNASDLLGLAPAPAVATAAAVAVPVYVFADRKVARDVRRTLALFSKSLADPDQAEQMYREAAALLATGGLKPDQRKTAQVNMARALVAMSAADNFADGLVKATDALRTVLADPPRDPFLVLRAAEELVEAMSVKDAKHGDLSGYAESIALLERAAANTPADAGSMALVHRDRATYLGSLADRAPEADREDLRRRSVDQLRQAIAAVTPPGRVILPGLYARLALSLSRWWAPQSLPEAIELCRRARDAVGWSRSARWLPDLALAEVLTARAWNGPDERAAARDLDEAELLCRRLVRRGPAELRLDALEQLAEIHSARDVLMLDAGDATDQPRTQAAIAAAWQGAATAATRSSMPDMVRVANGWVDWAESTEQPAWCADAYAHLTSLIPRVAATRYLSAEKDRLLSHVRQVAEEAGYWLARADRLREAVVALELCRAVAVSESLGRDRPEVHAALVAAGRHDLAGRHRAAVDRLGALRRRAPGDDDRFSTTTQRAWAEYDAVAREVAAVLGSDHLVAPVSYADIVAAAADGPLVYVAAAQRHGYALVVSGTGEPRWVRLPLLTHDRVRRMVEVLAGPVDRNTVLIVLRALWENGLRELASHLPSYALVTLVPVGQVGLVPAHAAGGPGAVGDPPSAWDYLADRVTVRYAANARAHTHAVRRAAALDGRPQSMVLAAAPNGDPKRPLAHTVTEVAGVARQWQATGSPAATIPVAGRDAVLGALPAHEVWHLASHCEVFPDRILDSALLLEDGKVMLADLLRLAPAPRRLAVLSACRSHTAGHALPDEAVGLPGGLQELGLAAVIASQWVVDDLSTAFLMTRFYRLWRRDGLSPARALAAAQSWLRHASHAELDEAMPGLLDRPRTASPAVWALWAETRPFDHPYHWAPFGLTGA